MDPANLNNSDPLPLPRGYHHGGLRVALIAGGLEMLEERGLNGLSLRALAARVAVSHTAPKNHFSSLADLRAALATEGFWRLAKAMRKAAGPAPGPGVPRHHADADEKSQALRALCMAYVAFAMNHPGLYQLMFSPLLRDSDAEDLPEAAEAAYAVLKGACTGLTWPSGRRGKPENPDIDAMIWSLLHGQAHLAISGVSCAARANGDPVAHLASILPPLRFDSPDAEPGG